MDGVKQILKNVKIAFEEMILESNWLDEATKLFAIQKVFKYLFSNLLYFTTTRKQSFIYY